MNVTHSNPHTTINCQNDDAFLIRLLKFVLKKLKIRELFERYIQDPRVRVDHYGLTFLLMHALLTHIFRSPSKNKFHQQTLRPQASAAVAKFIDLAGYIDHCPCPRTIDNVLTHLNPDDFKSILPEIFRSLCRRKVFQLHPELIPQNQYAIAIDAHVTHVYHDDSQHPCQTCPYCLKRTRGNSIWYLHTDLVAAFVAPNGLKIPILFHRIKARPGWEQLPEQRWKQECERTAFPGLLRELRNQFPRLHFCIHLDALYATDQIFTLLEELNMNYSIVKKAKVLKTVGEDCKGLRLFNTPLKRDFEKGRFKIRQTIHFFNDVAYRAHRLSIIQLDENAEKKISKRFAKVTSKKTHWEWIIGERLSHANFRKIASQSRLRWKEEDMFNDLQHRGFAICHDFNRAPAAQLVRTYLILIAYAICEILTYTRQGQTILSKGMTIWFMMEQMLTDLIYVPETLLFPARAYGQMRFCRDPPPPPAHR